MISSGVGGLSMAMRAVYAGGREPSNLPARFCITISIHDHRPGAVAAHQGRLRGGATLPDEARTPYVRDACGGDDELCREIESLLASYGRATDFLEAPVAQTFATCR